MFSLLKTSSLGLVTLSASLFLVGCGALGAEAGSESEIKQLSHMRFVGGETTQILRTEISFLNLNGTYLIKKTVDKKNEYHPTVFHTVTKTLAQSAACSKGSFGSFVCTEIKNPADRSRIEVIVKKVDQSSYDGYYNILVNYVDVHLVGNRSQEIVQTEDLGFFKGN